VFFGHALFNFLQKVLSFENLRHGLWTLLRHNFNLLDSHRIFTQSFVNFHHLFFFYRCSLKCWTFKMLKNNRWWKLTNDWVKIRCESKRLKLCRSKVQSPCLKFSKLKTFCKKLKRACPKNTPRFNFSFAWHSSCLEGWVQIFPR
jgi:hypothetical protein